MKAEPKSVKPWRSYALALFAVALTGTLPAQPPKRPVAFAPAPHVVVRWVSPELRDALKLDPFYQKHIDADGLPILSSEKVSNAALVEARYLIREMLAERQDVLAEMVRRGVRVMVMAPSERTTDVPEQRHMQPKAYWDNRIRGLGGKLTSCGEENLLNIKGDWYPRENILIHEFAHCIATYGVGSLDRTFNLRVREMHRRAVDAGLWKGTYAATDHYEYWAEGVQSYFDANNPPNRLHNHVNTREELVKYDPDLFELIDKTFKQNPWRYVRYDKRNPPVKRK